MSADREPGFWCTFQPPQSHVAALVQMPAHQVNDQRLVEAYMRDEREKRNKDA